MTEGGNVTSKERTGIADITRASDTTRQKGRKGSEERKEDKNPGKARQQEELLASARETTSKVIRGIIRFVVPGLTEW